MTRLLLLLCLVASLFSRAQTTLQQGMAYRYNGKNPRTPLSNVAISCASATNTVLSDSTGAFVLSFNKLRMGDRLGTVMVKKREMIVFNQQAVDNWSVRNEPLCLILCDASEFEKQKQELIAIGRREAEKKYNQQKAALEQQLQNNSIDMAHYEAQLNEAYEKLENLRQHIGEYAELFARIDQSMIDSTAQRATVLFNQGRVDEAVRLFEQGHYLDKLKQTNQNLKQEKEQKASTEQKLIMLKEDQKEVYQSLQAQLAVYKLRNEWDKIGTLMKNIADETEELDDILNYCSFCTRQNEFEEAETYYHKALEILEKQTQDDPSLYERNKMITLNNLALLYEATGRFKESMELLSTVVETYQKMASENPYDEDLKYMLAVSMNNLAFLYYANDSFEESETLYKEVLKIDRAEAKSNPEEYEVHLATALNNLGVLYSDTERPSKSEKAYLEALEIRKRLAKKDPQEHEPDVACTLDNLAELYENSDRTEESMTKRRESIAIKRRLAKDNPKAYESDLLAALYKLGGMCIKQGQEQEALQLFEEYWFLSKKNPNPSFSQQEDYEIALLVLSLLYPKNEHKKLYEVNQELLPIYKTRHQNGEDTESQYPFILGNLSYQSIFMGAFEQSERLAQENISIDPTKPKKRLNLAASLLFQGRYNEAEAIYRQFKEELKDSFLQDFSDFEEAGIIPNDRLNDVEKIKQLLNE